MSDSTFLELLKAVATVGLIAVVIIWIMQPEQQEAIKAAEEQAAIVAQQEERFYWANVNGGAGDILVDRETGVCYIWRKYMNAGGLTVLVDADGKPVIWEEAEP